MKRSERGFFYGDTTELIRLDGVTLTDTVYDQGRIVTIISDRAITLADFTLNYPIIGMSGWAFPQPDRR